MVEAEKKMNLSGSFCKHDDDSPLRINFVEKENAVEKKNSSDASR